MKKFTNVELYWASVHNVNDLSGKYQVDLANLTPSQIEACEGDDLSVRTNDTKPEMGTFITAKSKYPILVVDKDGNQITDNVGNGSRADVIWDTYSWKFKNKTGTSMSIKKIVVTELVGYEVDESEVEEVL